MKSHLAAVFFGDCDLFPLPFRPLRIKEKVREEKKIRALNRLLQNIHIKQLKHTNVQYEINAEFGFLLFGNRYISKGVKHS